MNVLRASCIASFFFSILGSTERKNNKKSISLYRKKKKQHLFIYCSWSTYELQICRNDINFISYISIPSYGKNAVEWTIWRDNPFNSNGKHILRREQHVGGTRKNHFHRMISNEQESNSVWTGRNSQWAHWIMTTIGNVYVHLKCSPWKYKYIVMMEFSDISIFRHDKRKQFLLKITNACSGRRFPLKENIDMMEIN